jgi:hypothetical protein
LKPSIPTGFTLIIEGSYSKDSILAVSFEPAIHSIQQVGRVPAIVVRKSDNLAGGGIEAGVAPHRVTFRLLS